MKKDLQVPLSSAEATETGGTGLGYSIKEAEPRAQIAAGNDFLQELHHRIKNNLQIVCSLLRIQGRGLSEGNAQQIFRRMEERIHSMALVYDKLSESGGYDSVQLDEYLKDVATQLVSGARRTHERPRLDFDLAPVLVPSLVATRLGLLLNEILSDQLRHRSVETGNSLELKLKVISDRVTLSLIEIGGVKSSRVSQPSERDKQVLAALIAQMKGEARHCEADESDISISFPVKELLGASLP